jgi:hypothetical protein
VAIDVRVTHNLSALSPVLLSAHANPDCRNSCCRDDRIRRRRGRFPKPFSFSGGKVDGNNLSFEVKNGPVLTRVALAFAGGHLKGEARSELQGGTILAKVDVQRVK